MQTKNMEGFLEAFGRWAYQAKPFDAKIITAERVDESFGATKESASAMDGWYPKELSLLSLQACGHIATMLNQIEDGAPWPSSAMHAKVVFLENRELHLERSSVTAP